MGSFGEVGRVKMINITGFAIHGPYCINKYHFPVSFYIFHNLKSPAGCSIKSNILRWKYPGEIMHKPGSYPVIRKNIITQSKNQSLLFIHAGREKYFKKIT